MARIHAPRKDEHLGDLPEYEPIGVVLESAEVKLNDFGYQTIWLKWVTEDSSHTWIFEYVGIKFGKKPGGGLPEFFELLSAVAGRARPEEVAWFDDETMEFSFDGTTIAGVLTEGARAIVRGKYLPPNKKGRVFFGVLSYHAASDAVIAHNGKTSAPELSQPARLIAPLDWYADDAQSA